MKKNSSKIFISYRREDSAGTAGRLYDSLERIFGQELIFKDVDNISIGENFEEVIDESIKDCDLFLAVIGKGYTTLKDEKGKIRILNKEDYIKIELSLALKYRKKIIPILVDNAKMPKAYELPLELALITKINAIEIRHEKWNSDLGKLAKFIEYQIHNPNPKKASSAKIKNQQEDDHYGDLKPLIVLAIIPTVDVFLLPIIGFYNTYSIITLIGVLTTYVIVFLPFFKTKHKTRRVAFFIGFFFLLLWGTVSPYGILASF